MKNIRDWLKPPEPPAPPAPATATEAARQEAEALRAIARELPEIDPADARYW